eukprot:403344072
MLPLVQGLSIGSWWLPGYFVYMIAVIVSDILAAWTAFFIGWSGGDWPAQFTTYQASYLAQFTSFLL